MNSSLSTNLGKAILRITCGGLLILHGSNSLIHGIDHVKAMVKNAGLPEVIAYGNLVGEFVAPLLLIVGYKSRVVAGLIAINMLATILIAHRDIAFMRNDFGGWMIELNIFYLMTAVCVILLGGGQFALSKGGKLD